MSFLKATEALLKAVNTTFGTEATYTQTDGGVVTTLKGVFDRVYVEIQDYNGMSAVFKITLADLPAEPAEDDTLLIGSTTYAVRHCEPDAHGSATLILKKA